jgi:glycosyltransferase involved in cell wall biosynthesis
LPSLVTGGVERGAVDIGIAIAEAGYRSIVASAGGPMVHELERAHVEHITLPLDSKNPLRMRANIGELVRAIDARHVDIVHARSRAPAWSAYYAARRTGRHFVTTFHGTYGAGNPVKRMYNSVMARGERVIAISEFIAQHIRERYRPPEERLRVIPRGIDIDRFAPERVAPPRIVELAQAWRLPDGAPVVLMPGRLTRWKGQRVLIEAMARQPRADAVLVLAGSDQGREGYRRELEQLIDARGLSGRTRLVGDCRDMPAAYMLADVVVSASTDPEAFGRVAVEAQAMGRPVVATDHGGARETILLGETGLLVPPGDAAALAAAIDDALDLDAAARERLAATGIAHARAHFSKASMCRATLAVYAELLGTRVAEAA